MPTKKDNILSAAEILFGHYGIRKTTMDEIAHKAHMSKSALYYYFKNKEDIFAEIIQKDLNIFKVKMEKVLNKAKTPQSKMYTYIKNRMTHLKELVNFYKTLRDEYLEHYIFVENIRKDFAKYEQDLLTTLLKEGIQKNVFYLTNINSTVRMISIALKGLEDELFLKHGTKDIETDGAEMFGLILKGIEAR